MVSIPLGLGDFESPTQNIPRVKLHNMYIVPNPTSADKVSRVSRPTLTSYTTVGQGPIYKTWQQPNVIGGDTLVLSGTELYRFKAALGTSTKVGNVPGIESISIAGTQLDGTPDIVVFCRDGILYTTDGSTISKVAVPDNSLVQSVATLNSYFIVTIRNSQKFYWMEPGDLTIDPLNFAQAASLPDPIISVNIVSDEIWFLGLSGPEIWQFTGDQTAPFVRISGRVYNEGCFSRDAVCNASVDSQPALFWVTNTKAVVQGQGRPSKVSNESVEELLKTSDTLSAWFFRYYRHDFYAVSSPLFTLVYDVTMQTWSRWDTYLLKNWVAQTGVQVGSTVYAGDATSNKIYTLTEATQDDALPVIREVSGFVPSEANPFAVNEVIAYVNSGWAGDYDVNPLLELRWSDDLGATYSNYIAQSLGNKGDYTHKVAFRSLGLVNNAGRIFEFRLSDPVRLRIDYCTLNERSSKG